MGDQTWPDLSLVYAPERVVFVTATGPVTGHTFLQAAHHLAEKLPDQPVVPVCADVFHFTLLFAAALIKGHYVLLSSDRSPTRLAHLAQQHNATCVTLAGDPEASQLPDGGTVLNVDLVPPDPSSLKENSDFNPVIEAQRLVAVVFTSGSTGQPVGHKKYWGGLVTRSVTARVLLDPEAQPASLVGTVPPYHMYGFETLVLQTLNTRVKTIAGSGPYPADWVARLEQASAPRILVTTPLQLRGLVKSGLRTPAVRRVVSASAPLPEKLAEEAERFLKTEVTEIYGSTETGSVAIRRTLSGPYWTWYRDITLQTMADGRVELSAPGVLSYVLADFIETGANGTFQLLGRVTDLLKLGGKRGSLAALNAVLNNLPGVEDGAFLPPDMSGVDPQARMQAFVVAPTVSADSLLQALRQLIDPIFLPRRIVQVAALPRNAVGKLTLQALRDLAATQNAEEEIGTVAVPHDHPCLAGHFPGQPVVPGVLLLEAAYALLTDADFQFDMVKFLHPVFPEQPVVFSIRRAGVSLRLTAECLGKTVLRAVLKARPVEN
ncbi:AMP-binding protein [Acetobacter indonesiensis]|uniref:AMP-binding protein n=1 Tax=Acetobacter indonesiensis TaxID=104101 RepID=UPI0015C512E3|nr:AMP-binding protein [Acetobacter indonesiensis]